MRNTFTKVALVLLVFSHTISFSSAIAAEKVVIVGGGLAGLTVLHELAKQGIKAQLYEIDDRVGGRILTDNDGFGLGIRLNSGAELLDRTQPEILSLAQELGVGLKNRYAKGTPPHFYFLLGQIFSERDFARRFFKENFKSASAYQRLMAQVEASAPDTGFAAGEELAGFIKELDRENAEVFLHRLGFNRLAMEYFAAGVNSELGRQLHEISPLVLFETFALDTKKKQLHFLPNNDESIVVDGGTQKIIDALQQKYFEQIHLSSQLVEVAKGENAPLKLGIRSGEGVVYIDADSVVMAISPLALNKIDWNYKKPKQLAVADVQFAGNTKLALLFKKKIWQDNPIIGMDGNGVGYQMWNVNNPSGSEHGIILLYTEPLSTYKRDVSALIGDFLQQMEKLYPGITKEYVGYQADEWPESYSAADRPGDRSRKRLRIEQKGPIYWAGEAYSVESQGYLNGAVETARAASRGIIKSIKRGLRCEPILLGKKAS